MKDIFDSWLVCQPIAHRGLHDKDIPENSLPAFQNAIDNGYAIELDVQMIADGTLVVFHDDSLSRLTNNDGYLKFLNKSDLEILTLKGSKEKIPTLEDVLLFIKGQTPILIEIKNKGKVGQLEQKVIDLLKDYKGEFAVQSFNPFSLNYFKHHAPSILRGQLSGYFKGEKLAYFKEFLLKRMAFNKNISEPHFISYDATTLPNRFVKKYKNLPLLAWTVRSKEDYLKVVKHCDNIIFENFIPEI